MGSHVNSKTIKSFASWLALAVLVILVTGVSFYSQAVAIDYVVLLKELILFGVLPQILVLGGLVVLVRGAMLKIGLACTFISWCFLAELALRTYAS